MFFNTKTNDDKNNHNDKGLNRNLVLVHENI